MAWNEIFRFNLPDLLSMVFLKETWVYIAAFLWVLDQTQIDIDATSFKGYFSHWKMIQLKSWFLKDYNQLSLDTRTTGSRESPYSVVLTAEVSFSIYMDHFPFQWGFYMYSIYLNKWIQNIMAFKRDNCWKYWNVTKTIFST